MKNLLFLLVAVCCCMFLSCSSAKVDVAGSIVITGIIYPVSGGKVLGTGAPTCWAMECGKGVRDKSFYQFVGEKELLDDLYEDGATATVRVLVKPDIKTDCLVGTVAEVIEIIEQRSKKD